MRARPFLKWAGGKTKLLPTVFAHLPSALKEERLTCYVEPFVGGGAMLLFMLQEFPHLSRVVANDVNPRLVNTYRMIRECSEDLVQMLRTFQAEYDALSDTAGQQHLFLDKRAAYNSRSLAPIDDAAHFIFLNKTCFNGLYRENRKGDFNVPCGRYRHPLICDEDNIRTVSKMLQKVELRCGDFSELGACVDAGEQTFVYMDPPYRPLSLTASFSAYAKGGFNDSDQERLKRFIDKLSARGAMTMLSNSDGLAAAEPNRFFDELYANYHLHRVVAPRVISAKAHTRGDVSELLICNYPTQANSDEHFLF